MKRRHGTRASRPIPRLLLPLVALLFVLTVVWCTQVGFAQDAPPDPPAAQNVADSTTPAKSASQESLGEIIFGSGVAGLVFYLILGLFSIVALSVALERFVNLRREKVLPHAFVKQLKQLINDREDTLPNLQRLCDGTTAPIANILKAGLLRAGRPLLEVEKGMEDAAAREQSAMRAKLRPLNVIGNSAPLVGLLGTVVGMILSFRVSSELGLGAGEQLARGIYIALLTTAQGLAIAIPCVLATAWFNAQIEGFLREMDEILLDTLPSFTRLEQTRGTTQPADDRAFAAAGD